MKKTYLLLCSIFVLEKCFATDSQTDKQPDVGAVASTLQPTLGEESTKIIDKTTPLRLNSLNPKRHGSWYTEHELGEASSLLQGIKQKDDFLLERPTSVIKAEQLKTLVRHFGKKRGKKIYSAILVQETSMTKNDVNAMEKFANFLHPDDQETFRRYIDGIKEEIPTVDRENLKENAQRYEGGDVNEPIDEDDLSFTMIEDPTFLFLFRNGIPVGVMVLAAHLPNGSPLLVRQRAFILRVRRGQ